MTCKPDFKYAYEKANEILVVSKTITRFPFSAIKLIKEFSDISICSFKKARSMGIELTDFGSKSAMLMEKDGKNIIFFNDEHPKPRIRFSLLHEFGHFILGHKYGNLSKEVYNMQEVETNFLTAQIFMPKQMINELLNRGVLVNRNFLIEKFGVSGEAADKRLEHLNKIRNIDFIFKEDGISYNDIVLMKYSKFLEDIKPRVETFEDYYAKELERQLWY